MSNCHVLLMYQQLSWSSEDDGSGGGGGGGVGGPFSAGAHQSPSPVNQGDLVWVTFSPN